MTPNAAPPMLHKMAMVTISISAEADRAITGGSPEPSLRDDRGAIGLSSTTRRLIGWRAWAGRKLQRRHRPSGEGRRRGGMIVAARRQADPPPIWQTPRRYTVGSPGLPKGE
jgi:hypothetical protein